MFTARLFSVMHSGQDMRSSQVICWPGGEGLSPRRYGCLLILLPRHDGVKRGTIVTIAGARPFGWQVIRRRWENTATPQEKIRRDAAVFVHTHSPGSRLDRRFWRHARQEVHRWWLPGMPSPGSPFHAASRAALQRNHQIFTRSFSARNALSVAWQENALANSGRLASGPLTRKRAGECGLVVMKTRSCSGRVRSRQACA